MRTDQMASIFPVKPELQQMEDSLCSHEHDMVLAATPRATQNPCSAEAFWRPEKLPEKLKLESKGPLPWSWTLPLAVDSPDKHAVSWTSSKSAVATAMSPISSGVLSGAHSRKVTGEMHFPPAHTAETSKTAIVGGHAASRGGFANKEMPERFLLESKSPIPWCWRMPLTCDSPLVSTCNFQACHPPSSSASSGNRPEQQFSRLRDGSNSCTSIVVLLQKLGRASDSTQVMELVRTSEEQFKDDKNMLAKVYRAAVDVYGLPRQGMPVDEFCDLSVKCIRVLCQVDPAGARTFHFQLLTCSLRRSDARIYEACAAMEEHLGSVPRAVEILQQGLELDAQPSAMLHRMLQRLKAGGQLHAPQQGVNPMRDTHCQTFSPSGVRTPSSGELRDDAKSGGTPRDDISVHFASLCEEVSVMRSLMEQNLRVQLAVQRDLQDLRAQFGGTPMGNGCCQGHACLRCCREAVEGAVETLMTSMVGVRGNVQVESTSQPMHDWQPLADEVWDCLTRVGSKRRRCEMQNLCCGINKHRVQQQLAASFAEIPELRKIVDWHLASAKPQAEILAQEEQKWEPLSRPDTATNSESTHLVLQEPLQRQRAAALLAVGEHFECGVYKENVCPKSPEHGLAEFMSKQLHSNTLPVPNSLRCLR